jgi:hypothetical protein
MSTKSIILERDLEAKVVRYAHDLGLLAYKFTSPAHRGVPDRLIVGRGRVLFLELKRKGCVPTALQARELERINQRGVAAGWADDFETAQRMINDTFTQEIAA